MSQPGHEREQEVALLRRQVAEEERARAASDVLCRSLADETQQLRRTLAATAHMCQHLAKCLDARRGAVGDQGPEVGCGGGLGAGDTACWPGGPGRSLRPACRARFC